MPRRVRNMEERARAGDGLEREEGAEGWRWVNIGFMVI